MLKLFHLWSQPTKPSFLFLSVTIEDFKENELILECSKLLLVCRVYPPPTILCNSGASITSSSINPSAPFQSLLRGVKHNPALFNQLNDHIHWGAWRSRLKSASRVQNVDKVLVINYNTINQDYRYLFDEKKKIMHSDFGHTFLTDQLKYIVRSHENYYDAQASC